MAKANIFISSFNAGELSRRLDARTDVAKYFAGCRIVENMLLKVEGGASKRPGTYFANEAKHSDKTTILRRFVFSADQKYILEFGDKYIRFYTNHGRIASGATPVEVATPYKHTEIRELCAKTQSADVLYLTHKNHAPRILTRTSHINWSLSQIVYRSTASLIITGAATSGGLIKLTIAAHGLETGRMVDVAGVAGTVEANGRWIITVVDANNITLQGSVFTNVWTSGGTCVGAGPFVAHDITACADNGSGLIRVTTKSSHSFSTGNRVAIEEVLGCLEANGAWIVTVINATNFDLQASVFSYAWTSGGRTSNKWPGVSSFFEQRLSFAGTYDKPLTVYQSTAGDYYSMITGTNDDDALVYTLAADTIGKIVWMVPEDFLMIGSNDSEWRYGGNSKTDPITPASINAKRQSSMGSENIQGILVGDAVLFIQKGGRRLRELAYSLEKDKYVSPDMTRLAYHISESGIVDMVSQSNPDPILWCTRDDGQVATLIYNRPEDVIGWSRQLTGRDSAGRVESVAIIPSDSGDESEVWFSTIRVINGTTKRYIEYMMPFDFGNDPKDAFFVDCGLTFDGGGKTAITAATAANPVVLTIDDPSNLVNGAFVRVKGCFGMIELNDNIYKIAGLAGSSFNLTDTLNNNINGLAFHAFSANLPIVKCYESDSVDRLIRVRCAAHGLVDDQEITIFGVLGCIEANGVWDVTVIDAANFDLQGSSYKNQYLSGGKVGGYLEVVGKAFAGIDHLDGEEVAICADGGAEGNDVVSGGIITLSDYFNKVHIGLPFRARLQPMKPDVGGRYGMSQGVEKRIDKVIGRFEKSRDCSIGTDEHNLVDFNLDEDGTGELFTGDKEIPFDGDYDNDALVMIESEKPLPLNIVGLMVFAHGYEG